MWAYFNNNPVGVFDLPAQFPVIANEPGTLLLLAGIDYDGLRGYEVAYPFYLSNTMQLSPKPGSVIHYTPSTGYHETTRLAFSENFDAGVGRRNNFRPYSIDSTYLLNIIHPDTNVMEGGGSGLIELNRNYDSSLVLSLPTANIQPGSDAYIELNYKGDMELRVGMYSVLNSTGAAFTKEIIGFKASSTWNKAYIGIKEFISAYQGSEYRILIRADRATGSTDGKLYIDNVKLVTY